MFKHMGSRGGVKTRRDWDEIKGGVLSTREKMNPSHFFASSFTTAA